MTAAQLLILAGVIMLAHEITPKARAAIGLVVGSWGVLFAAFAALFF